MASFYDKEFIRKLAETLSVMNLSASRITNGIFDFDVLSFTGEIPQAQLNIADRGWTQTCTFSSYDAQTIAWTSGSFISADGTTYSISAGDTGTMAARSYIYLDITTSETEYQTTATAGDAVGLGKVMIGTAMFGAAEATFETFGGVGGLNINAANIVAGSITANEIAATTITAAKMAADVISGGYIVAGLLTASNIQTGTLTGRKVTVTASGGGTIELDPTATLGLRMFNVGGNLRLHCQIGGLADGDITIGDYAGGTAGVWWDDSAGTLNVKGSISIASGSSGITNLTDANLDNITNGSTYYRTTANQVTGAGRAYTALDSSNRLVTNVLPGTNIGTPAGSGLFLGADYMGYYSGAAWTTYIDSSGNFRFNGTGDNSVSWAGSTLSVYGNIQTASGTGQRMVMDNTSNTFKFYNSSNANVLIIDDDADFVDSPSIAMLTDGGRLHTYRDANNDIDIINYPTVGSLAERCQITVFSESGTSTIPAIVAAWDTSAGGNSDILAVASNAVGGAGYSGNKLFVVGYSSGVWSKYKIKTDDVYYVGSNQVVGAQGAAIADVSEYTTSPIDIGDAARMVDLNDLRVDFNTLLSRLRTHGLIDT